MLANAKMQVLTTGTISLKISSSLVLQRGLVRWAEISGSAQKPGYILRQNVKHFARSITAGDTFRIGGKNRQILVPSERQLPALHQINLVGQFGILNRVRREQIGPLTARFRTPRTDTRAEMFLDSIRYQKLRTLPPSVATLGEANLFLSQRLTVSCRRVLLVRRTVTDMAVEDDEGWAIGCSLENLQSGLDSVDIIGVADAENVPTVPLKSGGNVLCKSNPGISLNGDVVVVVDPTEIA